MKSINENGEIDFNRLKRVCTQQTIRGNKMNEPSQPHSEEYYFNQFLQTVSSPEENSKRESKKMGTQTISTTDFLDIVATRPETNYD